MAKYRVREGFVAHVRQGNGSVFPFEAGSEIELTAEQYDLHAHQVEPVIASKKEKSSKGEGEGEGQSGKGEGQS